jgi:hypothetical protein
MSSGYAFIQLVDRHTIAVSRHWGVYAEDHSPPGASDQAALTAPTKQFCSGSYRAGPFPEALV